MPVKGCQGGSKSGYKYGDSGKCYVGKGGKATAERQGRTIKGNQENEQFN